MSDTINSKTDEAIRKLMVGSIWGRANDIKSLTENLQLEFDELIHGITRKDITNCFEESADVLMLVLCILYKMSPTEREYTTKLIRILYSKLSPNITYTDVNREADEAVRNSTVYIPYTQGNAIQALSGRMKSEFRGLTNNIKGNHIDECFEKAADLFLSILYLINNLSPNEDKYVSKIVSLLHNKLYRRYSPVLQGSDKAELNIEEENAIWQQAKKEELQLDLIYCPNPACEHYCDIATSRIEINGNKGKCSYCDQRFIITKNCILLGEYRTNKRRYLSILADAIVDYYNDNAITPKALIQSTKEKREAYKALLSKVLSDDEKTVAFIKYMSANHSVSEHAINGFISLARALPMPEKRDVLSEYLQALRKENIKSLRRLNAADIKRIHKQLLAFKGLPVVKIVEKNLKFNAKSWSTQVTRKLVLQYDAKRKIECMAIVHYNGSIIRDLTFELSNMYGCPVKCAFCASGELSTQYRKLNELDFIKQINALIDKTDLYPNDFQNFFVSFAGIGEPSISYKEVSLGMKLITEMYPHVQFNIATIGFNPRGLIYWRDNHTNIRTIQIPYYSTNHAALKQMARNLPKDYDLESVISSAIAIKETNRNCRVKINYIIICNYNDTDDAVEQLCAFLSPYKNDIEIKISYLNETLPSKQNGLCSPSPERMLDIHKKIIEKGFNSYIFGTKDNPILGCGQLVQSLLEGWDK